MPLTTLDPKTALIIIDLQKGIVAFPTAHPIDEIIKRASSLADAFRRRGLPVALVNVAGGAPGRTEQAPRVGSSPEGWTDLIPELNQQPGDIVVTKRTWGAFASTDIEEQLTALGVTQVVVVGVATATEEQLTALGVTQVVVVGVATATGVESTARQAYEAGFNVSLAIDAMTDMRPEAHDHSVAQVFPRLGETGTTQEILDLMEGSV